MSAHPRDDRRAAMLAPHRREHERSVEARLRHPQSLRDLLRELREAIDAESVERLHVAGVEPESQLGAPRMSPRMASRLGPALATTERDGDERWVWPHRSALARLALSRSGVDRAAASMVALLPLHRYHAREAWAAQAGALARPEALEAADAWAAEALRRWWREYVTPPRARMLA